MDPVVADKCLPTLVVGDKDELHRPFHGGEDWIGRIGLLVSGDKTHVPRRDPDESQHVVVAADSGRVPRSVLRNKENQYYSEGGVLRLRRREGAYTVQY